VHSFTSRTRKDLEAYAPVPAWANRRREAVFIASEVSGPLRRHAKHEEEGASPKMAKRLEEMLGRRTLPATADPAAPGL
jgi:hypothetical protein